MKASKSMTGVDCCVNSFNAQQHNGAQRNCLNKKMLRWMTGKKVWWLAYECTNRPFVTSKNATETKSLEKSTLMMHSNFQKHWWDVCKLKMQPEMNKKCEIDTVSLVLPSLLVFAGPGLFSLVDASIFAITVQIIGNKELVLAHLKRRVVTGCRQMHEQLQSAVSWKRCPKQNH